MHCAILNNAAYEEQGYRAGYTQGIADGLSKVNVQYTYHVHTGNSSTGSGCYTIPITNWNTENCSHPLQSMTYESNIGKWVGIYSSGSSRYCPDSSIRREWTSQQYGTFGHRVNTTQYISGYNLGCGKNENTIESATIIY